MVARHYPREKGSTKVSIAQPPTVSAPSLREIASQAWAGQQAEVAERRRQEAEFARERFVSELHRALRGFIHTYEPLSPFTEADVEAAEMEIATSADGTPFEAIVTFAGETFRYHPTPNCGGEALWHVRTCDRCEARQESTGSINSLADLGYWLEQAPKQCACAFGEGF